jgi:GNAT superfamily N-acetyltransferase
MGGTAVEAYVAGALARWDSMRRQDQLAIAEPGAYGLLPCADDPRTGLLITDDRGYETLRSLLARVDAGTIRVFAAASRCAALLEQQPNWTRSSTATAMVCGDLGEAPTLELPDGLTLRRVRRLRQDPADGVPLEDAAAAARRADPRITDPLRVFAEFLRSLSPAVGLLAAVDTEGAVRATSGFGVYGAEARVFFVNTDPHRRREGIGRTMTAAALRAARDHGARRASLDATETSVRVYQRLGFDAVTETIHFSAARTR